MKKLVLLFILFVCGIVYSQQKAGVDPFHSPKNIKLFAENLFCSHDYLRSINEFEQYLQYKDDDTVRLKIALAYMYMDKFEEASGRFKILTQSTGMRDIILPAYSKTAFRLEDYNLLKEIAAQKFNYSGNINKLSKFSSLMSNQPITESENSFLQIFTKDESGDIAKFYKQKTEPGYVSPFKAALLSAIIPGAGKIYAGELSDGIVTAVLTGLLGYLAYDNFHAKHLFRAWLFTGTGAFFYASSIYGSAAQAEIYNVKVDVKFRLELASFLQAVNFFLPKDPDFANEKAYNKYQHYVNLPSNFSFKQ